MPGDESDVPADDSGRRHPRAFAQGTGVVFQTAGLVLMLAGCCIGSFFGLVQKADRAALQGDAPRTVFSAWRSFETHQKLAAISVFATCVGGLGALAAGIGLQWDRFGSARFAAAVTVPLALYHLGYSGFVIIRGPWGVWMLMPLGLATIWSALSLLALVSANVHAQNPPPYGPEKLPPGFRLPSTAGDRMAKQIQGKHDV